MKGKNNLFYGVFGLGVSGKATLDFLNQKGYKAIAWDDSQTNIESLGSVYGNIDFCDINDPKWEKIDCLILSPGVPLYHPEPHPIVTIANKHDIEIICDIELFYRHYPNNKYIGITGTNGKSTTTALIAHILESNELPYQMLGNIGKPILSVTPSPQDTIVVELSSYQLDLVKDLHCNVAILLNITPDHLDRHGSMDAYTKSKYKIFNNQNDKDHAILNHHLAVKKINSHITKISGDKIIKRGFSISEKGLYLNGTPVELTLPYSLRGSHNHENTASAYAAVKLATELTDSDIILSIKSFAGLKYRMQLVGKISNLTFVNDSKGTNFESTKHALDSFQNIYWIAGGKAKTDGIQGIGEFADRIKLAFLVGESQEFFAKELDKYNIPYHYSKSLKLAFIDATHESQRNSEENIILFSPAAASFDQWKNFEERGAYFTDLVEQYVTLHQKNLQI